MHNRSKKSEVEFISAYPRPGLPHVQFFQAKNVPKVETLFEILWGKRKLIQQNKKHDIQILNIFWEFINYVGFAQNKILIFYLLSSAFVAPSPFEETSLMNGPKVEFSSIKKYLAFISQPSKICTNEGISLCHQLTNLPFSL